MDRENFGSRLGFILVSAGCAIGIGNVWKFPWLTGQNGGGFFVLIYLIFLAVMGLPILTMELAVGRASRQTAVRAYKALAPNAPLWGLHAWASVAGNYLLMMYYTTVSGWMLGYFIKFLSGAFSGIAPEAVPGVFGGMLGNAGEMTGYMLATVFLGFSICGMGVQKGVEAITKIMMAGLLVLIMVLAVHNLMLPGAAEGLKFYLMPSWDNMKAAGVGNVVMAAMNQAFFTLSIGMSSMAIFGSYMSDEYTLTGESVRIVTLDTFVAVMAGLIIFPACFSFGVKPDAGPSLIFITLPKVFMNMAGGRLWGTLFFLFMTFASFSTVVAVFENILRTSMDNWGWSRQKAVWCNLLFIALASMPCVLGYNLWSSLRIIGARDVLDSEDFLVSGLILPLGSLVYLLFCVNRWGWGFDNYLKECNKGRGLKMPSCGWLKNYFRYVLPLLILIVLAQGLM